MKRKYYSISLAVLLTMSDATGRIRLLTFLPMFIPLIGTFGNILNMELLSRKTFREKPVFLLLFLSVFDFFTLWTMIPWCVLGMYYGINYCYMFPNFCKISACISVFSVSASFWKMAIVTVDRSVVVLSHTQRNVRQNRNKNLAILSCIVFILLVVNGVMTFYGHREEETSEILDCNMSSVTHNHFNISAEFESDVPFLVNIAVVF